MKRLDLSFIISFGDWHQQSNVASKHHPELVNILKIQSPESYISFLGKKNTLINKHTSQGVQNLTRTDCIMFCLAKLVKHSKSSVTSHRTSSPFLAIKFPAKVHQKASLIVVSPGYGLELRYSDSTNVSNFRWTP